MKLKRQTLFLQPILTCLAFAKFSHSSADWISASLRAQPTVGVTAIVNELIGNYLTGPVAGASSLCSQSTPGFVTKSGPHGPLFLLFQFL